jgi:hypothetical protein
VVVDGLLGTLVCMYVLLDCRGVVKGVPLQCSYRATMEACLLIVAV